jgi:hypothetical protein
MDKHKKKQIIVVKTFKRKGPRKWFGHFRFFNHSLKWFLMVTPKDKFTHKLQKCNVKVLVVNFDKI